MTTFRLTENLQRLGTETAFDVLARAAKLQARGAEVINLGIGQPDFPTPDHIVEAGIQALRDGHHGYTPANGILPLREAVCADQGRRHGLSDLDPEQVVVVPGGKVTMFLAILMCGGAGSEILYPDPSFPIYGSMAAYVDAKAVPYALREEDGFSMNAEQLLAKVNNKTSLIILNSPCNPTGALTDEAEVAKLVRGLEAYPNVLVMSDEIYSELLYDQVPHKSLLEYPEIRDRVLVLDGWSKTFAMTGWRLGYGLWPRELAPIATRLCINIHSCVNAAAQYAAIAALEGPRDPKMMEAFDRRRHVIHQRLNELPGVSCLLPGGAFYAFPNIEGTGYSAAQLQDRWLEDIHVASIAGTSFGQTGEKNLRFSFANSQANIEAALEKIGNWLVDHPA